MRLSVLEMAGDEFGALELTEFFGYFDSHAAVEAKKSGFCIVFHTDLTAHISSLEMPACLSVSSSEMSLRLPAFISASILSILRDAISSACL